jgi:hypothetical protein
MFSSQFTTSTPPGHNGGKDDHSTINIPWFFKFASVNRSKSRKKCNYFSISVPRAYFERFSAPFQA